MAAFRRLEIGGGGVRESGERGFHLAIPPTPAGYTDAQIDDYSGLPRSQFPWRAPVRLTLRARSSAPEPVGTLGFGFWNDPFSLSLGLGGAARRLPAAPNAIWFFYGSDPNDFSFDPGVPGRGWKAASLHSAEVPTAILAAAAASAAVVSRIRLIRPSLLRAVRRVVRGHEAILDVALEDWNEYAIEWDVDAARFSVNGRRVLEAPAPHPGPLGFVAWIDNQYAILSPAAGIRFGNLATDGEQSLDIKGLKIEAG